MRVLLGLLFAVAAYAQVTVSADLLSPQTTAAMFGRLPKQYAAAGVSICNDSTSLINMPLARAAQQVRATGIVLLPRDAALSVIAAAQGSSLTSRVFRGGVAVVQLTAIAAGWSGLSSTVKGILSSASGVGTAALGIASTQIPTHTLLTFANEVLPDPVQLPVAGCASGIVIVELMKDQSVVMSVVLPKVSNQ